MGLTNPGSGRSPNVIYAECNSTIQGGLNPVTFDTFYDENEDEIDSGDVAAALAAIGLVYASDKFTALERGSWLINVGILAVIESDPAELKYVQVVTPTYWGSIRIEWGGGLDAQDKPNFPMPSTQDIYQSLPFFAKPGPPDWVADFYLQVAATAGAVDVISYATLDIFRLL